MPVPSQIAFAAGAFRHNRGLLEKSFKELTPAEWLSSPNASSNHILWIVGHLVWARTRTIHFLGSSWDRPWLKHFGRGSKRTDGAEYPSPEEMTLALEEVSAALTSALENVSEETLSAPAPERMPTFDGTVGGLIAFLADHEAYHVGQAAYLRTWMGKEGING